MLSQVSFPGGDRSMPASLRPLRSRRRDVVLPFAVLGMGLIVGSWFLADHVSEQRARDALLQVVAKSSSARLNGQTVDDPSVLLRALRTTARQFAHHSSPVSPIRVELMHGGQTTAIVLARDSVVADEFWVYRPGSNWHGDPLGQEAGRVTSAELSEFLRRIGL